ncbi:NUDIX hydrolase [Spirillospora sp. NBC_00431]
MAEEAAYYAGLARTRGSAGALLLDPQGRVLLARPHYKPVWDLPGGVIDADESPIRTCRREVREELGITPVIERLIGVIWIPPWPLRPPSNVFVFGGRLTEEGVAGINARAEEIAECGFFDPAGPVPRMEMLTARKISACVEGYRDGATVFYEEWEKPGWYGPAGTASENVKEP